MRTPAMFLKCKSPLKPIKSYQRGKKSRIEELLTRIDRLEDPFEDLGSALELLRHVGAWRESKVPDVLRLGAAGLEATAVSIGSIIPRPCCSTGPGTVFEKSRITSECLRAGARYGISVIASEPLLATAALEVMSITVSELLLGVRVGATYVVSLIASEPPSLLVIAALEVMYITVSVLLGVPGPETSKLGVAVVCEMSEIDSES